MPLIACPACGRQISIAAEACPQCGHPNRPAADTQSGPRCYHCSAAATTRCQCCGVLSCAVHLQPIYVNHGRGGANELRCNSCYGSAMIWKVVGFVIFAIIASIIALVVLGAWH